MPEMPDVIKRFVERNPRLPALVANTLAGKLIQIIKNKALDPTFGNGNMNHRIKLWSEPAKGVAEWVFYSLSGAVRTMPEPKHPVAIALQAALAETLTEVGIKINEISATDRMEVIDMAMPVVHGKLADAVKEDGELRDRISIIFGSEIEWENIISDGEGYLSYVREKTQFLREARRARGWRRFL